MFDVADGSFGREESDDVKTKRRREFKTGQHQNFGEQAAVFGELFFSSGRRRSKRSSNSNCSISPRIRRYPATVL